MFDPKSLLNALSTFGPKGLTELFEQLTGHKRYINTTTVGEHVSIEGHGHVLTFCPDALSLHHGSLWRIEVTPNTLEVTEAVPAIVPADCIEVLRKHLPHQSFVDINTPDDEVYGVVAILEQDVIAHRAQTFYVFDKHSFMRSTRYVDQPPPGVPSLSMQRTWGEMTYATGIYMNRKVQCIIAQENGQWSVDWFGAKTYIEQNT